MSVDLSRFNQQPTRQYDESQIDDIKSKMSSSRKTGTMRDYINNKNENFVITCDFCNGDIRPNKDRVCPYCGAPYKYDEEFIIEQQNKQNEYNKNMQEQAQIQNLFNKKR